MQRSMRNLTLVVCAMLIVLMTSPLVFVSAQSLDDLSQQTQTNQGNNNTNTNSGTGTGQSDIYNSGLSDALRGLQPVGQEQMDRASTLVSPFANIVGTFTGVILLGTAIVVGAITALDLSYIMIPFLRSLLNPNYMTGGAQAQGGAMGGMPMGGMGMRGGMMGGGMMGGGMMGGAQQQAPAMQSFWKRQWVSDEAVYCVNTYALAATGGAQPQGGGMPMGGGMMGGGMGMMGGGMMGGGMMGGGAQPAQPMPLKNVALEYLKKRTFVLIIFAAASIILTSSVLTGCGINLGQLVIKIMNKLNGNLANIEIN